MFQKERKTIEYPRQPRERERPPRGAGERLLLRSVQTRVPPKTTQAGGDGRTFSSCSFKGGLVSRASGFADPRPKCVDGFQRMIRADHVRRQRDNDLIRPPPSHGVWSRQERWQGDGGTSDLWSEKRRKTRASNVDTPRITCRCSRPP